MEEKAADEFPGGERHGLLGLRGIGTVVLVGEADVVMLDVEQPVIGDRDAVRAATDVVEDLLGPRKRPLGVDHPLGMTRLSERARPGGPILQRLEGSHEAQGASVVDGLQVLQEEATEEAGEHAHRQEEAGPTRDPAGAIRREAPARDDTMEMGMMPPAPTLP